MPEHPRLLHTVVDTTSTRRLAEFYRALLGLQHRPGDEPAQDQADDDRHDPGGAESGESLADRFEGVAARVPENDAGQMLPGVVGAVDAMGIWR